MRARAIGAVVGGAVGLVLLSWMLGAREAARSTRGDRTERGATGDVAARTCSHKGLVRGRVTSGGAPMAGAAISLDSEGQIVFVGVTGTEGTFTTTVSAGFSIIVEAPAFDFFATEPKSPLDCEANDLVVDLPQRSSYPDPRTAVDVTRRRPGWHVVAGIIDRAEVATITLIGAFRRYDTSPKDGKFEFDVEERPPYDVYAGGPDWVRHARVDQTNVAVVLDAALQLRRVYTDAHGIVWLFSDPAGLYFMERELTNRIFDDCVAVQSCTDFRRAPDASVTSAKCNPTPRPEQPIDCLSQLDAENACKYLGGRLPTEDEWQRENYPQGQSKRPGPRPTCAQENVLRVNPRFEWGLMSGIGGMCDGTVTSPGCKHKGRSPSGLCDFAGNLGEWVAERGIALGSPFEPFTKSRRGLDNPAPRSNVVGARCVKEIALAARDGARAATEP